jgi:hypothetical protein
MAKKKTDEDKAAAALKAFANNRGSGRKLSESGKMLKDHQVQDHDPSGNEIDLEKPMTPREVKFLDIFYAPQPDGVKVKRVDAARLAGFTGSDHALRKSAFKVIQKFATQTDPREIFRRVGASEAEVAEGILAMAKDDKLPASVRLNAWVAAAKCLGLHRENVEEVQGAKIIICGPQPGEEGAGPGAPSREETVKEMGGGPVQTAQGVKPLAIVR